MVLLNHVTEDGFEDISALMTDISEDDGGRQGISRLLGTRSCEVECEVGDGDDLGKPPMARNVLRFLFRLPHSIISSLLLDRVHDRMLAPSFMQCPPNL
ncbi:hypothetical protein KC331_g61 [Hortaea werneckii]|nr:hypothetical protein KC331_g61 [Hortaea werneckii]